MTRQRYFATQGITRRNNYFAAAGSAKPDKFRIHKLACGLLPLPMIRGRANTERRIILRTLAALLVLVGHCFVSHTAAAQSQDCKLCREDYTACVKAHTQGACKTNYDICMNHCRKK